jgi:hypothetical protein
MKYFLISFSAFKKVIDTENISIKIDEISGYKFIIDDNENKFSCQENINFDLPHCFYVEKYASFDDGILINYFPLSKPYNNFNSIVFTNKYIREKIGRVLQINLSISPSSCIGSLGVNKIVEKYDSMSSLKFDWSQFKQVEKVLLNYVLKFKNNKGNLTIHEIIIKQNSFSIIHWATTNIDWFYYDYDSEFYEGLSIKEIIYKYANDETKERFNKILKISDIKKDILLSYEYYEYDEQDMRDDYERLQWLKEVRNDWMDNASDYWNID